MEKIGSGETADASGGREQGEGEPMNSSEIAKLAQVSRATVSHVLNGHPNVSAKTRAKVEAVMREHNYFPNEAARKLVGKNSRFFALFLIDFSSKPNEYTIMRSPFFHEFVGYAIDIANKHHYHLVTTVIRQDNLNDIDQLFQSGSIAGGIILGDILSQKMLAHIASCGYKLALCHQVRRSPAPNILVINQDNYKFGQIAAEAFLAKGHTRLAHITGESYRVAVQDRLEGFVHALTARGIPFDGEHYLTYGEFYPSNSAYETAYRFLERNRDRLPTGIFLASAMMRMGAVQAILDFGLRIPEDISLIVLDDANVEQASHAPISAVTASPGRYAMLAIEKLIELVEDRPLPAREFMIPDCELVSRGSVRDLTLREAGE